MTGGVGALLMRLMFARYLLASIAALSCDFAIFLALDHGGATPLIAASAGYTIGLIVHWIVSTRFVFIMDHGPTHIQRVGFIITAGVGMATTMALVGALSAAGMSPAIAKLLSVPASFIIVYAIRKYVLFAKA
ncbi:GtrA family protein [Sphingobium sp.]|uniref:GtrA family protein n=1 Tax=Sphingobium sp. TaxID=1912891 RepID=UPI003B3A1A33